MIDEVWKDIAGYEEIYQVSDWGRFKRIAKGKGTRPGRIRKLNTNNGYAQITLCKNGEMITYQAHILIALAFIGPCPEGMEVNHKDLNKCNNRIDNLEYVTHQENINHAVKNKAQVFPIGEDHHRAILTNEMVLAIRSARSNGAEVKTIAKEYGIKESTIYNVLQRRSWNHI